jgi:molybdopterin-binding protein
MLPPGRRRDEASVIRLATAQQVVASITKDATEELELAPGKPVTVLVKSTEVMLGVE